MLVYRAGCTNDGTHALCGLGVSAKQEDAATLGVLQEVQKQIRPSNAFGDRETAEPPKPEQRHPVAEAQVAVIQDFAEGGVLADSQKIVDVPTDHDTAARLVHPALDEGGRRIERLGI